jgi:2-polyprenyl-3-methyl-5-hydroxy-6-metoxy-1,4-benzoquinol methylase
MTASDPQQQLSDLVKRQMNQPQIHDSWEKTYRTEGNELFFEQAYDRFVGRLGQRPGSLALDIGCGICANSLRLARRGYLVFASDYSEPILAQARDNVERSGLSNRININREDILSLSYPTDHFDLVVCWGVLMHVPDAELALRELVRVTKPGGFLVLEEIGQNAPEAWLMRTIWSRLKKNIQIVKTPRGYEHTTRFEGETLFWRHTDIKWLLRELAALSCGLVSRDSGMFSEMYIYAPGTFLRSAVSTWNRIALNYFNVPQLAYHNIFVFRKTGRTSSAMRTAMIDV